MIRYDLVCTEGHRFDGWFRDSAAYDEQAGKSQVTCPTCGTSKIEKQIMAPGIPTKSNRREEPARVFSPPADPRANAMLRAMRELRKQVESNAEYVGDKFAEEARRIHYQEKEARGIYGETTAKEAAELIEEGIEVHPLPNLPEDGN
jgi:hypothetical protein